MCAAVLFDDVTYFYGVLRYCFYTMRVCVIFLSISLYGLFYLANKSFDGEYFHITWLSLCFFTSNGSSSGGTYADKTVV